MADPNPAQNSDTSTQRTFQIPVENAAPDTHVHKGKTFKIPIESKSFNIPVEETAAPASPAPQPKPEDVHSSTGAYWEPYQPSWWQRGIDGLKTGYVGRNLGFGESFAHETARRIGEISLEDYQKIKADEKKGRNSLMMIPIIGGIMGDTEDKLTGQSNIGAINLGALMTNRFFPGLCLGQPLPLNGVLLEHDQRAREVANIVDPVRVGNADIQMTVSQDAHDFAHLSERREQICKHLMTPLIFARL